MAELSIPTEVSRVTEALEKAGFEAFIIGGCVRDLLLGRKPKDWDVTTNATPEKIQEIFENTFYENDYGTVGVVNEDVEDESLKVIEVTPYRLEANYSDGRRPDSVTFGQDIKDDLKRRDFTINAIAANVVKDSDKKTATMGEGIDLYKGHEDLKERVIRTVGEPEDRFREDALRIVRAVRISAELGFRIDPKVEAGIKKTVGFLKNVAKERLKDEFIRIIMSERPAEALELAKKLGILAYIVPELEEGVHVKQNQAHAFDVWTHSMRTLQHSVKKKYGLSVRLAALFHDIGKPRSRRWSDEKRDWTFYGHDVIGSRVTRKILTRLSFPVKTADEVVKLVRYHMFFSDTEQITLSAVRRLVARVGKEDIWKLIELRLCDRIGTGRPKESPYRLRKFQSMIEEVMMDPVTVSMLKIDGSRIMEICNISPGPKIGLILHALLDEVLEDPKKNTAEYLEKRALELSQLPDKELQNIGEGGKERLKDEKDKNVSEIRKKYWVK